MRLAADMPFHPFRAIIIRNGEIIPMSSEFTPETERQRLQYLVSAAWVWQSAVASGDGIRAVLEEHIAIDMGADPQQ